MYMNSLAMKFAFDCLASKLKSVHIHDDLKIRISYTWKY